MRIRPAGHSALLLECRDSEHVEAWRRDLDRRRAAGELVATDIVPGERTLLLDGIPAGTADMLANLSEPAAPPVGTGALVDIPVAFTGPDLDDVAERWGTDPAGAVDQLASTELVVAFCGFAPGFGYLRGLPADRAVPRLAAPRPRVPAGSVGLAGRYAGIYPTDSPGGWRLVGHTGQNLWDVRREPPALLTPGTRVRLVPA